MMAQSRIHPLAHVDPAARIEQDVEIGPFCIVGPQVTLGAGSRLIAHVHLDGHTEIGPRCVIHPYAVLGGPPQSVKYAGEPTRLSVGSDCVIREGVTMNRGTAEGSGHTMVGDRGYFMTCSHVGHDCVVGNDVILANSAALGGHCEVGDFVFIGGLSPVHQFTRIGQRAMIAGMSAVRGDVIPYGMAEGPTARLRGLNTVGMRRHGLPAETRTALRRAYRMLFDSHGSLDDRLSAAETELGNDPAVSEVIAFLRERGKRPICYPRGTSSE